MAAYSAGVRTVLIPEDNMQNLEDIDTAAREALNFIPCKKMSDVLSAALVKISSEALFVKEASSHDEEEYPEIIPDTAVGIRATVLR